MWHLRLDSLARTFSAFTFRQLLAQNVVHNNEKTIIWKGLCRQACLASTWKHTAEEQLHYNNLTRPLNVCLTTQRCVSQESSKNNLTDYSEKEKNLEEPEPDILYKRIQIEARSADRAVLDSYEKFVSMTANYLSVNLTRCWEPFRTIKRRTLLRSAFVKKKYRVQYEFRTYYRCMEFKHLTGSTADTFLEYIERNLPEGVALKVTRHRIEALPSHLRAPPPPPPSQPDIVNQ